MVRDDRGWRGGTEVETQVGFAGASLTAPPLDLSDPDFYGSGDPHAVWRRLRNADPVHWNASRDGSGFWAVTTYDLAREVHRRDKVFGAVDRATAGEDRWECDPARGPLLALPDAARRAVVRSVVARASTPPTLARLESTSRSIAARLVGRAIEQGSCELVEDVAARLPVAMTCDLMGVPREDWGRLYEIVRRAFGAGDPGYRASSTARAAAARAHAELMDYYGRLVAERRDRPGDDVVSALAAAEVDGVPLPPSEILQYCEGLIVIGQEMARHAVAGGLLAFAHAPDQWGRLRDDASLVPSAVEEVLRWTSPGMCVPRAARCDVELGGRAIRAGDTVMVFNASANRDAAAFEDPDAFDVGRTPNRHLALGSGAHAWPGAALVRLELSVLLAELRRSVRRVRVVGPVSRLRSNLLGGYTAVPMALDAA